MDTRSPHGGVVLRPMWGRFAWAAALSINLLILPPFLSLYWLTAGTGGWPTVLALHASATAIATLATLRVRHAVIEVGERTVSERGYFGRLVVTPREEIESILVVPLLAGTTGETTAQLFVLDHQGTTRIRMRGQYWPDEALRVVEHALDVPVQRAPAPVTRHELRERYGPKLYWYERHPALTLIGGGTLCAVVATPVFVLIERLI